MVIVIALTVVQFRYVERKVQEQSTADGGVDDMIENRPLLTFFRHLVLIGRRARSSRFPSTSRSSPRRSPLDEVLQAPMPLVPGHAPHRELPGGARARRRSAARRAPVGPDDVEQPGHGAGHRHRQDRDLAALGVRDRLFPLSAARTFAFWMIFVTLMLPVEVRILPDLQGRRRTSDMLDTYAGLTLPLIASATATFLFRQFFLTIPDELAEAARIDGAGPMRFFCGRRRAAVADQHRRAVRDHVHLRLEPVPVAAAGDHAGERCTRR